MRYREKIDSCYSLLALCLLMTMGSKGMQLSIRAQVVAPYTRCDRMLCSALDLEVAA